MLPSVKEGTFAEVVEKKFLRPDTIDGFVAQLRQEGKTIATLNGSFDLLHAGHLEMIYQASLQADVLIVALNTDSSIQRYKSVKRPIISLQHRMQMMGALAMVDYVTYFDETDPRALLRKIAPDVHVNGAEYGSNCIESEVVKEGGGKVHIVSLIPGLSTSQIIQKIVESS